MNESIGKYAIICLTAGNEWMVIEDKQGGQLFDDTEAAIERTKTVMVDEGGADVGDKFYLMECVGVLKTEMTLREVESDDGKG